MIRVRRACDRGHFNHGWLDTSHTFSFGDYHDPAQMGFRSVRVINEDRVQPGKGFPTHGHRDMEIVTVVIAGALEHKDSLGTGSVIRPGEVQRMTAGTGVTHSEYNASQTEPVHFMQIWILPARPGLPPGYEQKSFPATEREENLRIVASPDGRDGSVTVHQDARLYVARLGAGVRVEHPLARGRHGWVLVMCGAIYANDQALDAGDGAALSDEAQLTVVGREEGTQVLVFDLA
jgi:redox-sensitive bicupin YhaK (pirin superfamily)